MTIFDPGDLVWVPFPFVEAPRFRDRPALVVSKPWQGGGGLTLQWVLMVTSAANAGWPDDISLADRHAECGLRVPCVIRPAKITTIDTRSARELGKMPADLFAVVRDVMRDHLTPAR